MSAFLLSRLRDNPALKDDPAFGMSLLLALSHEPIPDQFLDNAIELGFSICGHGHFRPPLELALDCIHGHGHLDKRQQWSRMALALLARGADPAAPAKKGQPVFFELLWFGNSPEETSVREAIFMCLSPESPVLSDLLLKALENGNDALCLRVLSHACHLTLDGKQPAKSLAHAFWTGVGRACTRATIPVFRSLSDALGRAGVDVLAFGVEAGEARFGETRNSERNRLAVELEQQRLQHLPDSSDQTVDRPIRRL